MSAASVSARARVRRHVTLETAVRPHTLLLIGVGLSFLAWAIPWGSAIPATLRGFEHATPWTLHGTLFLLGWYAFFFVVAFGGFQLGRRIPVLQRAERVPWESYYVFLSIVSFAGIAYSYGYIVVKSPHAVSNAFLHHQFNALRYALPYSAGVQTLRYAASLSGAIAIFELGLRRFRLLHVVNIVVLLLLAAALASRISLIIAAIAVAGLAARHLQAVHVRARLIVAVLLLGVVTLFLALSLLNYSRNADFYRSTRGSRPARHERRGDGPLPRHPLPGGRRRQQPRDRRGPRPRPAPLRASVSSSCRRTRARPCRTRSAVARTAT